MAALEHKIDFALIVTVKNANPNGDPLNGNRPRETYDGYGEISDVCIKRKIRNRFQDMGENIFVQSADRATDEFTSLQGRAEGCTELKAIVKGKKTDAVKYAEAACREWIDVRTFGQVFAFKDISVGVRGPVSIQPAISVSPIDIVSMQITKSVNGEDKAGRSSDTMGMKHSVDFGMYVIYGSVNCQLAEKTGFSAEDAALLKEALKTLFENDCSSARPEGSMEVCRLYWWEHDCKMPKYSSAKVHRQLKVNLKEGVQRPASFWDYEISLDALEGLYAEIIDLI
ncbi:type I-C CRISPR-associated protein Cas7/Csd2 [uncultured Ruminococcus sp.]|uniref:type I-C CRISPR-associated protein Cas7/Csd2 n=1 Tax=uncultured Ruminococcus sp. TaxID=165186 RepID=UPI002638488C|nr:type I-C CRISPR-associated protein Cas7/Csd2 [uncultured Ruminococcus sp.]